LWVKKRGLVSWIKGNEMRKNSLIQTTAAALLILMVVGCSTGDGGPSKSPGQATAPAIPAVQVTPVISMQPKRLLKLPGELVAYQDVALLAKVQGFVQQVKVDRGSRVRQGQLLIQLSAPELAARRDEGEARARAARALAMETAAKLESMHAQRMEIEAKLAADEATYSRLKAASATQGVVPGNDLEIAQKNVDADRARLRAWEENEKAAQAQVEAVGQNEKAAASASNESREVESYLRITAPFDGVITERNVHDGSLAGPSGPVPMLRIQQVAILRLVVSVPEAAVGGVAAGSKVSFTTPAFPGESFSGTVRRIAHALDVRTRTMPVELEVDNADGRLSPGMYAETAWPLQRPQPSLFVPATSIVTTTERTFVIRVREETAEWVDVTRGASVESLVEVFGKLSPSDLVLVRATDELKEGTRIRGLTTPSPQ
jgi:membrane fusion protein, multidrug efflux system